MKSLLSQPGIQILLAGLMGTLSVNSLLGAEPRGKAERVVVVVWDGMRPDFITPQYTPHPL